MDYFNEFFGFKKDPFETNHDVNSFYISSIHKPVLSRLYRSVYEDGIDVLIGEEGTGKTITVKKFLSELQKTKSIYVPYTDQSFDELMIYIGENILERELEWSTQKIISEIENYTRDNRTVIVIDNIHEASLNTIENLRIFTEIKNIKLVLVGNGYLEKILRLSSMKQLSTRVRNILFLNNLNKKDTKKYIDTRLYNAGGNVSVSRKVYGLVYDITKGTPYKINLLMEEALYLASLKKKKKIKPSTIRKAAKNLGFKVKRRIGLLTILIVILLLAIFGIFSYYSGLIPIENIIRQEVVEEVKEIPPEGKIEEKEEQKPLQQVEEKQEEIIKPQEKTEPITAKVSVGLLNIRENPDTTSKILVEEREDGWVKVRYYSRTKGREIEGWVKKKYLDTGSENE